MNALHFSFTDLISLFGIAQCLYLLTYVALRAGHISKAGVPVLYFIILCFAFLSDFIAPRLGAIISHFPIFQWFFWFSGPPVAVLLIIQIAQITKIPAWRHFTILLLIPLAAVTGILLNEHVDTGLSEALTITGLCAGALSLLYIWVQKDLLASISIQKSGHERYWLIIALITMNIGFLGIMLFSLESNMDFELIVTVRGILGLSFVYLAITSLFRIYPPSVRVEKDFQAIPRQNRDLSDEELEVAMYIERLLKLEKIYQEPAYSRKDLADECNTSEAIISKVINVYFEKTFPQLINECRIEDAKRLLRETEAPVRVIAEESGFNSLPSFNRVFKDISGLSPTQYRKTYA